MTPKRILHLLRRGHDVYFISNSPFEKERILRKVIGVNYFLCTAYLIIDHSIPYTIAYNRRRDIIIVCYHRLGELKRFVNKKMKKIELM